MEHDIQDGESVAVVEPKNERFQVNHSNYKVSIPNNENMISSLEISSILSPDF